jgi:hypothetical protein
MSHLGSLDLEHRFDDDWKVNVGFSASNLTYDDNQIRPAGAGIEGRASVERDGVVRELVAERDGGGVAPPCQRGRRDLAADRAEVAKRPLFTRQNSLDVTATSFGGAIIQPDLTGPIEGTNLAYRIVRRHVSEGVATWRRIVPKLRQ